MAATTKVFLADSGVSLMSLMLAHYDRFDPGVGRRTLMLRGGYVGEKDSERIAVEVLGSDIIMHEAPCPLRPTVTMEARSWWIRGRLLTGESVVGYFNPHLRTAILGIEER